MICTHIMWVKLGDEHASGESTMLILLHFALYRGQRALVMTDDYVHIILYTTSLETVCRKRNRRMTISSGNL